MARILVLGAGVMGSAITVPLTDAGHDVRLVGTHLDAEPIASIRSARLHPRLRSPLPESVLPYTHDQFGEAIGGVELVILGVSSAGIDWQPSGFGQCYPLECPSSC